MTDRVAGLRDDIERAPAALVDLVDAYVRDMATMDGVRTRLVGRRVVFTGLGSSRFAAMTAAATMRSEGLSAWEEFASTSRPTPPAEDVVLIAISASGRTREVVAAADRHRGTSTVVAVTNAAGSPLATAADVVLPLHAGSEAAGISTLTYRATLAVLGLMTGGTTPRSIRALADRIDAGAAAMATSLASAADLLDGVAAIDLLADEPVLGIAEQAALMLREAPRLPARAGETGDWLHTAVYLALPGHRAVLFAGSESDAEVVATVARRGGAVIGVGAHMPGSAVTIATGRQDDDGPIERAILESVVADRLAVELWDRTSASG